MNLRRMLRPLEENRQQFRNLPLGRHLARVRVVGRLVVVVVVVVDAQVVRTLLPALVSLHLLGHLLLQQLLHVDLPLLQLLGQLNLLLDGLQELRVDLETIIIIVISN